MYNLIINASIVTPLYSSSHPTIVTDMNNCQNIQKGAVAYSEKILAVDSQEKVLKEYPTSGAEQIIDASDNLVIPGFVDSHTHISFKGTREQELEWKLEGLSYREIAVRGGGILSTTQKTREASLNQLIETNKHFLDSMLLSGTTTIEAKSGYGLETSTELKQLQAIEQLNSQHPIDLFPTFLGAHAIPSNITPEDYTQIIIDEMIPAVKKQQIAKFIDVFCEEGYFSINQTRRIITEGIKNGLRPKIHVDEIAKGFGGSELAAEMQALSADHLLEISSEGITKLAEKKVIGTLLPGTPFVLRMKAYPPARKLIDRGVAVSISTDFNPNCMLTSMMTVMMLSSYQMAMKPNETLTAATINGAWAIDQAHKIGSLTPGKKADILILEIPNIHFIAYYLGQNTVKDVIKDGKQVVRNKQLVNVG